MADDTSKSKFAAMSSPKDSASAPAPAKRKPPRYRHVAAIHSHTRPSRLSRDANSTPSFVGFRNLMVLVLIVMNLRLAVENYIKYGFLVCIRCHDVRRQDLMLGGTLFAIVPAHLLIAYLIEVVASYSAKAAVGQTKKRDAVDDENEADQARFRAAWRNVAIAHTINSTLCLAITNLVVYFYVHHPGIGTLCSMHAITLWLKNCSYAFTNRDLRHAMLHPSHERLLPELYSSCPYPQNITLRNLVYFWWAPTLVYQPVYPRSPRIRWSFLFKRVLEFVGLSVFIWLMSAQYAAPVLRNSLEKLAVLDFPSIVERVMKLSTISLVIWLAGFFALFQSFLNALAEVTRFGDRNFYDDWWNSTSLQQYWSSWNKPVYHFMKRHVFLPLVGRGWPSLAASTMVFIFSGILHELAVGVPTHNLLGLSPIPDQ